MYSRLLPASRLVIGLSTYFLPRTIPVRAVLFVVAAGISETGGLDFFLAKALGQPSTLGGRSGTLLLSLSYLRW